MNKGFVLFGILLFIIGSVLVLGAYFVFNQYSTSGTHLFSGAGVTWQIPKEPFELNEGDKLTVRISVIDGGRVNLFAKGTDGNQVQIGSEISSNVTLYYYAQTSDLYFCSVMVRDYAYVYTPPSTVLPKDMTVTLNIDVMKNGPNFIFLLGGGIVLFAGAITIPTAVLYKGKNGRPAPHIQPLSPP